MKKEIKITFESKNNVNGNTSKKEIILTNYSGIIALILIVLIMFSFLVKLLIDNPNFFNSFVTFFGLN